MYRKSILQGSSFRTKFPLHNRDHELPLKQTRRGCSISMPRNNRHGASAQSARKAAIRQHILSGALQRATQNPHADDTRIRLE